MEIYNTKYVCSYNDSDVFFESELAILNEDEKIFIREALYRRDLCNIFNIEDQNFNEKIITPIISGLFKNINGEKFIKSCMTKVSNKFFYSSDLELGFMVLFSFDYLYLVHPCISEFIETGRINEFNKSLIELKKMLF
jgi:hypothetical protein